MPSERSDVSCFIALVTLAGFTVQMDRMSDGDAADTLDDYFALAAAAIESANGRIVKLLGDGVLAVFPPADGDAGVLALLALQRDGDQFLRERGWSCRVMMRVHFGTVVAGQLGPGVHRRFDVLGKAVNATMKMATNGVSVSSEARRELGAAAKDALQENPPS